jgi:hypothetical protein
MTNVGVVGVLHVRFLVLFTDLRPRFPRVRRRTPTTPTRPAFLITRGKPAARLPGDHCQVGTIGPGAEAPRVLPRGFVCRGQFARAVRDTFSAEK